MPRLLTLFVPLCALACDPPRTCAETTAFVDVESQRIAFEHAEPCSADADCIRIEDDLICDDGVVALGGCGKAVVASREDDARAALDGLRDEVCSTARDSCGRDVDCGDTVPTCVDGACALLN